MEVVVEFHGFKDNLNKYIVKEFAVVGKCYKTQVLFKSPYDINELNEKMRRTARWLSRHFHLINWDDGDVQYSEEFMRSILKPFSTVYTKGLEKAEFLREFHNNVKELDLECKDIDVACMLTQHNSKNAKCALRSAQYYAQARVK